MEERRRHASTPNVGVAPSRATVDALGLTAIRSKVARNALLAGRLARGNIALRRHPEAERLEILASPTKRIPRLVLWQLERPMKKPPGSWAPADWYVAAHHGGWPASVAGIVDRAGTIGGEVVKLGLVGSVWTRPSLRGRGLASLVLEEAHRVICDEMACSYGMLMCTTELTSFYERLGWETVAGPVVHDSPTGRQFAQPVVMYRYARRTVPPSGVVDLHGLPY